MRGFTHRLVLTCVEMPLGWVYPRCRDTLKSDVFCVWFKQYQK